MCLERTGLVRLVLLMLWLLSAVCVDGQVPSISDKKAIAPAMDDGSTKVVLAPASIPVPGKMMKKKKKVGGEDHVTLSPTPLYSAFSQVQSIYEMNEDGEEEDVEYLPNVAVNASCMLSSSISHEGNFCRLSDEGDRISTASEENPYIIVDLENLYYVDHISFGVNVDQVSEENKLLVWCSNSTQVDIRQDVSNIPYSWRKLVLQNSANFSLHVHSACSYVRVQRLSFGPLTIQDLKVYGALINNRDMIDCMTGHDGEICSSNGKCVDSQCKCSFGYTGPKCNHFIVNQVVFSSLQGGLVIGVLVGLIMYYRHTQRGIVVLDQKNLQLFTKLTPQQFEEEGDNDNNFEKPQKIYRSLSAPEKHNNNCDNQKIVEKPTSTCGELEGELCFVFSSPLVMAVSQKDQPGKDIFRPIQGLDIKREYGMLKQSLKQAATNDLGREIPISVSCATVESFHTMMTLGNAKCIHFSGHCTKDFIAFEDAAGQLHSVSMQMLRGLLRSTVTTKSFKTLRLVVLNACNSENAGFEFILSGVPHVVAMRKKVRDQTASTFSRAFYLALGCGRTVGDAFESAREAVYSSPHFNKAELDSFRLLPEKADHAEVIFKPSEQSPSLLPQQQKVPRWPRNEYMQPLPNLCEDFVGRHSETWTILKHLAIDKRRLVVMHAKNKGMGTSQIATSAVHHLSQRRCHALLKDGIHFVKCEDIIDSARHETVKLAAIVDALWKAFYPLISSNNTLSDRIDDEDIYITEETDCLPVEQIRLMDSILDEGFSDDEDSDFTSSSSSCDESASQLSKQRKKLLSQMRKKIRFKVKILAQALVCKKARCLLVLDGLEESKPILEIIGSLLERVHGMQILITTRQPFLLSHCLNLNVINYHVGPLHNGDAALLFVKHLNRKLIQDDGQEVRLIALAQHPTIQNMGGVPVQIIQSALNINMQFPNNQPVNIDKIQNS